MEPDFPTTTRLHLMPQKVQPCCIKGDTIRDIGCSLLFIGLYSFLVAQDKHSEEKYSFYAHNVQGLSFPSGIRQSFFLFLSFCPLFLSFRISLMGNPCILFLFPALGRKERNLRQWNYHFVSLDKMLFYRSSSGKLVSHAAEGSDWYALHKL